MRERFFKIAGPALLAFLASGISTPRNYAESVTVPLSDGTYRVNTDDLCLYVSTEKRLKSSLEVKISSGYCRQDRTLSTGSVIFPAVNFRDRIFAQVDLHNGSITRITQVKK